MRKTKINQATVDTFAKKLEVWSKTLPKEERKLVRLLIDRATAVNVGDLGNYNLTAKVGPDAERIFKSLQKAAQNIAVPSSVKLIDGELWLRSNWTVPPGWTQAPTNTKRGSVL